MKKLLAITVLGLLCMFSFKKEAHAVSASCIMDYKYCTLLDKLEMKVSDLNPLNYLEKRKECQRRADMADTVYLGKKRYKYCMENYPD